jgi:glycosyltransferase involved in cell wall biosynthesis
MRILHLVNHCIHGHGNVHVAVDLACGQAQIGHSVLYASAGGDYVGLLRKYGVVYETVVQNQRNPFRLLSSLIALANICRSFKPDIIHAHMMAGAVFGKIMSLLFRIPLITTVHNSFDRHSLLMRLGDKVVAVSDAERALLISQGYNPERVAVVMNGSNISPRDEFLEPTASSVLEKLKLPFVTTVCGLHQRKGVHDLIKGFAEIADAQPTWSLYIVGSGPDEQRLLELAQKLELSNRVFFLGQIKRPNEIMRKADIFVLASYAEPFGLALAEAREAGCAIVATAVGGIPEVLDFGKAGVLVQPGSPSGICC